MKRELVISCAVARVHADARSLRALFAGQELSVVLIELELAHSVQVRAQLHLAYRLAAHEVVEYHVEAAHVRDDVLANERYRPCRELRHPERLR